MEVGDLLIQKGELWKRATTQKDSSFRKYLDA
jgi:hypothetical protein